MNNAPQPGQTAIYFLVDPRQPENVRYVGKADAPRSRHLQHCAEGATSPKGEWIETLRQQGIFPQMIVVEWVPAADADRAEKLWIARVKPDLLTNNSVVCSLRKRETTLSTMQEAERDLIARTLKQCAGNKKEAAKRLGIGRQTIYNKIKTFAL